MNQKPVAPTSIEADERIRDLAAKLDEARRAIKQWAAVEQFAKDELFALLDGADVEQALIPGSTHRVAWIQESTRVNFDKKAFVAANPGIDMAPYETAILIRAMKADPV